MSKYYVSYTDTSKKESVAEGGDLDDLLDLMREEGKRGVVYEYDNEMNTLSEDGRIISTEFSLTNETLVHVLVT